MVPDCDGLLLVIIKAVGVLDWRRNFPREICYLNVIDCLRA